MWQIIHWWALKTSLISRVCNQQKIDRIFHHKRGEPQISNVKSNKRKPQSWYTNNSSWWWCKNTSQQMVQRSEKLYQRVLSKRKGKKEGKTAEFYTSHKSCFYFNKLFQVRCMRQRIKFRYLGVVIGLQNFAWAPN